MSIEEPSVPYGYCQCGCGGLAPLAAKTTTARGYVQGQPVRFIAYHHTKAHRSRAVLDAHRRIWEEAGVPYGFCLCGCEQRTSLAASSDAPRGYIKGEPRPYRSGHKRKARRYRLEDRGHDTPCWIWQMWLGVNGYGYMKRRGKQLLAHRVSYEEAVGVIPDGLILHHLCEVPMCINPAHLEPLTRADHQRRHADMRS